MALSKELGLISDSLNSLSLNGSKNNLRRDSFEDRFCDDLCEDILQYLSLEDRFRLECVSKQFQRTVFQSLKELDLDDKDYWVTDLIDTLADKSVKYNCFPKLKSLSTTYRNREVRLLLPELKAFPGLERLELRTHTLRWEDESVVEDYNSMDSTEPHEFSFKLFKSLPNITHLSLHFYINYYNQTMKEWIFKDIDINLPNLQYLEIKNKFDTTSEGVTEMADILSRLSRLQTLKLKFISEVDFKPIEEQITKKCPKIKEINIRSPSDTDSDEDYGYYMEYGNYYGFNYDYYDYNDSDSEFD